MYVPSYMSMSCEDRNYHFNPYVTELNPIC
jgi:hypothetical protein